MMSMARLTIPLSLSLGVSSLDAQSPATPDTAVHVAFGAFVDGYYAFDFGRPVTFDRTFTTQAARSDEFNVNLAYVEAKMDGARVRGRLALQYGTSVQANYAGEPRIGANSGRDNIARFIQEATAGARLGTNVWIDGGIFLSHIGSEGWISRDNLTYTRSLNADYSPYYQSGVKVTWQPTSRLTAQLDVVNGWQIISESNTDKSAGIRLDYVVSPVLTLSYWNLAGREPSPIGAGMRLFNGANAKLARANGAALIATVDAGRQKGTSDTSATWYDASLVGRTPITRAVAVNARAEYYNDDKGVITGVAPFKVTGASLGLDVTPQARLMWRTEARLLHGTTDIFPDRGAASGLERNNMLLVTSLAMTF
jgi:hypothetical protein